MRTYSLVLEPNWTISLFRSSKYRLFGTLSPLSIVPFALSKSIRYGFTRPILSPNSLRFSVYRNCMTACCLLILGCSAGRSTIENSLPTSQQLRVPSSIVSTISWSLNTNSFHASRAGGFLASGGSWYLRVMVVPSACVTELEAAASSPEFPKLGFSTGFSGSSPLLMAKESP